MPPARGRTSATRPQRRGHSRTMKDLGRFPWVSFIDVGSLSSKRSCAFPRGVWPHHRFHSGSARFQAVPDPFSDPYTRDMQLRTLGGLGLAGADFARPKPLLLLAYLALEGPQERASPGGAVLARQRPRAEQSGDGADAPRAGRRRPPGHRGRAISDAGGVRRRAAPGHHRAPGAGAGSRTLCRSVPGRGATEVGSRAGGVGLRHPGVHRRAGSPGITRRCGGRGHRGGLCGCSGASGTRPQAGGCRRAGTGRTRARSHAVAGRGQPVGREAARGGRRFRCRPVRVDRRGQGAVAFGRHRPGARSGSRPAASWHLVRGSGAGPGGGRAAPGATGVPAAHHHRGGWDRQDPTGTRSGSAAARAGGVRRRGVVRVPGVDPRSSFDSRRARRCARHGPVGSYGFAGAGAAVPRREEHVAGRRQLRAPAGGNPRHRRPHREMSGAEASGDLQGTVEPGAGVGVRDRRPQLSMGRLDESGASGGTSMRCSCSCSGRGERSDASRSAPKPCPPSSRSAGWSRACRWRSSWRRAGSGCCRREIS